MRNINLLSQVANNTFLSSPNKTVLAVLIAEMLISPVYAVCSGTTDIECDGVLVGNLNYNNVGLDTLTLTDASLPGFIVVSENSGHATFLSLFNSSISAGGTTAISFNNTNGGDVSVIMDKTSSIVSSMGGVHATSNGSGDVTMRITGDITAGSSNAISANSVNGNIDILTEGSIKGNVYTIGATSSGLGNISIRAVGLVQNDSSAGDYDDAFSIRSNGGLVNIDTQQAHIESGRGLVIESTNGGINLALGNINARNISGADVFFTGSDSSAKGINITTAANTTITSFGSAITASSMGQYGGVNIVTNGSINSNGSGIGSYIDAVDNSAAITIATNGTIFAQRFGIMASTKGSGAISLTANGAVSSATRTGISGISNIGDITINANGPVSGVTAIRGESSAGNVSLNVMGNTTGTAAGTATTFPIGNAMQVTQSKTAVVTNGGHATTLGTNNAVIDVSAQDWATINNQRSGRIDGASDWAINSRNGNMTVNNDGTIVGYVTLLGANNVFNNTSPNSFDMRNYVNGVQGTAISQINGAFNNGANGVVRLLTAMDRREVNSDGVLQTAGVAKPSTANHTVQGQLLGVTRFNNAGVVTLQGVENGAGRAIAGDLLTITASSTAGQSGGGSYVSQGGSVRLDTRLNEGGANSLTDMLILDRTETGAGGATRVYIANDSGLGGYTGTGSNDGIKVVSVLDAGASATDAFTLGAPVSAGAFEYSLRQANGQDWFLQTSDISDSAKVQTALPVALQQIGLAQLGTLWQRVGSRRDLAGSGNNGIWLRSGAKTGTTTGNVSGIGGFSYANAYQLDSNFVQLGFDHTFYQSDKGMLIGSLMGDIGNSELMLRDGGNGEADIDNRGIGLALTWFDSKGYYVDGVAKWTRYSTNLTTSDNSGSPDGDGNLLSLEAGYQWQTSEKWAVVPQVQLVHQSSSLNSFKDAQGQQQNDNDERSLHGRAGVALHYNKTESSGLNGYVKADVLHAFQGDSMTMLGNTELSYSTTKTSAELGLGGNWTNEKGDLSAYLEVDYDHSLDGLSQHGLGGTIGVRKIW